MKILIEAASIVPGTHCGIENFIYCLVNGFSRSCGEDEILLNITPGTRSAFENFLPEARVTYLEDGEEKYYLEKAGNNLLEALAYKLGRSLGLKKMLSQATSPRPAWCRRCEELADAVLYPTPFGTMHFRRPVVKVIHDFRDILREPEPSPILRRLKATPAKAFVTSWPDPFRIMGELMPERRHDSFMIPFQFEPTPGDEVLDIQCQRRMLIYPASNGPDKNHEALIRALGLLKRRRAQELCVICPGFQIPERAGLLNALAAEEGVREWIHFLGFVPREHIRWLYRITSGVVATTKYEAFSGAVLEAFQYGKPVACSRIPALSALIDPLGIRVRYFDPDDLADIASAIEDILNTPQDFRAGSLKARDTLRHITPESAARQYREVLAWACGKAEKPTWHPYKPISDRESLCAALQV